MNATFIRPTIKIWAMADNDKVVQRQGNDD
jgi:hypothetical protein